MYPELKTILQSAAALLLMASASPQARAQEPTAKPLEAAAQTALIQSLAPEIRAGFARFARENHVPGLVWGVVADGRLVLVEGIGVRSLESRAPVDADTRFRIASMSKAFTALTLLGLRDEGRLRLDEPAETYVPELKGWSGPTTDAPRIRVRDLLAHAAGLVTDDPWGDRQTPLAEADFTRLLAAGVPFSRVPGEAYEYSNLGYATLGRVITNVSGRPFESQVAATIFRPLGMASTGYDVFESPAASRALGYRWQQGEWLREPDMARGAFGAMGGVETTANDYARYASWLLSAWPARSDAEAGPLKRATVREIVQGLNFVRFGSRRADIDTYLPTPPAGPCAEVVAYGMGFRVIEDCDLGHYLTHTGGYPGYGSVLMLVPEAGIAVFGFANRTYAAPVPPAYAAMARLKAAGLAAAPQPAASPQMLQGYRAAAAIWAAANIEAEPARLAINMLMDKPAKLWNAELASLKAKLGSCQKMAPVEPQSAMAARFRWACERGTVEGSLLMAPTPDPRIQQLVFTAR